MRRALPLLLLVSLMTLPSVIQADDKDPVSIRLYAEGKESDGESFTAPLTLGNPPKEIRIRNVPVISEHDISEFYPFAAANGSIAAYLQLDAHGTNKLMEHTVEYRDTMVVLMINGRVVTAMMVDKKITDGLVYIPGGFYPIEIAAMQARYPIIGKEKEFPTQKKQAEALLKAAKKKAKDEAAASKKQKQ